MADWADAISGLRDEIDRERDALGYGPEDDPDSDALFESLGEVLTALDTAPAYTEFLAYATDGTAHRIPTAWWINVCGDPEPHPVDGEDDAPSGDTAKIRDACLAARDDGDIIPDACARVIASQWHCGNMSVSFSSTGAVTADPEAVWREMFLPEYDGAAMTPEDRLAADSLRTYLEHAGERGPVAGWSGLWL